MRISDWSSDVCSSDLNGQFAKWGQVDPADRDEHHGCNHEHDVAQGDILFRHPPRIEAGEEYTQAQRHKRHSVDQKAIGRVIALRHWKSRRIAGHKTCLTKSIQPAAPGPSCSAASVRDRSNRYLLR